MPELYIQNFSRSGGVNQQQQQEGVLHNNSIQTHIGSELDQHNMHEDGDVVGYEDEDEVNNAHFFIVQNVSDKLNITQKQRAPPVLVIRDQTILSDEILQPDWAAVTQIEKTI